MDRSYKKGLESNIWKYAVYMITGRRVFWPIVTVYFLMFPDTAIRQIGYFLAAGQVVGFVLEVPSGYIADKIGHKMALILSKGMLFFSTLFYLIGGNFWMFAVGSALFSGSIAFQSGTTSAFMQETLMELGREAEYSRILGRMRSLSLAITAGLLAVVPSLAGVNIRLPIAVGLIFDIIGFSFVLTLVSPKRVEIEIEEVTHRNFYSVFKEAARLKFIPVIVFTALLQAILMGVGTLRDVYQQFIGIPIVYLGVLFALSRVVASAVSGLVYRFKLRFSLSQYFLAQIIFFVPLIFAIGYFQNKWLIAVLFIVVIGFLWGRTELTRHYELEYIAESRFKATLLSLNGLLVNLGFAGSGLLLGLLADRYLYSIGYISYAIISLVLLIVAYMYFLAYGKKPEKT